MRRRRSIIASGGGGGKTTRAVSDARAAARDAASVTKDAADSKRIVYTSSVHAQEGPKREAKDAGRRDDEKLKHHITYKSETVQRATTRKELAL